MSVESELQQETEETAEVSEAAEAQETVKTPDPAEAPAKRTKREAVVGQAKDIKGKISNKRADLKARTRLPKFLRFLTIIFALNFIGSAIMLILSSRDYFTYDTSTIFDFMNIVYEMILLWMIWCRFKCARVWALIFTAANVILGWSIHGFILNDFDLSTELMSSFFDFVMFFYFLFSKKARACLTEPFGVDRPHAAPDDKELKIDRLSWPFYRNLGIYFCVFSLVGHWMEAGCSQLMALGIIQGSVDYSNTMLWRDWFYPFPMEGLAVVLIALLLYPLWRWLMGKFKFPGFAYLLSFIANMAVCVSIEFTMGMLVNANHQLWDYTSMPFNFMGQVCAQNAIGFGLIASIIAWMVYPALERLIAKAPKNIMNLVFVAVCAAYMIPQTLYLIDPPLTTEEEIVFALESQDLDDATREKYEKTLEDMHALQDQQAQKNNASSTSSS